MTRESFGQWLNAQLKRRDWNQAEFARQTGSAPSRVNDWIRDVRMPSPASCERIADALRIDVDEVLARVYVGHRLNHVDDAETAAMIVKLRRIQWTPDRRHMIDSMLESLLNADEMRASRRSPRQNSGSGAGSLLR